MVVGLWETVGKPILGFAGQHGSKAINLIRYRRKYRVGVLGPEGTGKTVLASVLSSDSLTGSPEPVSASVDIETEDYNTDRSIGRLLVGPGQEARQSLWAEISDDIRAGTLDGLIYTCANGYHAYRDAEWQRDRLRRPNGDLATFVADYAADRRQREMRSFHELILPALRDASGNPWVLLLVTKQDLWWDDRDLVTDYYRSCEIAGSIRALNAARQRRPLRFEVFAASLKIEALATKKGQVLVRNSGDYDQVKQTESVRQLKNVLLQYRNRFQRVF